MVKRGGKRTGAGRKPKPETVAAQQLRERKAADAVSAWEYLVQVMQDAKQPAALRVDVAKYLTNQIIGTPRQAVEMAGEVRLLVMGKSTWKP